VEGTDLPVGARSFTPCDIARRTEEIILARMLHPAIGPIFTRASSVHSGGADLTVQLQHHPTIAVRHGGHACSQHFRGEEPGVESVSIVDRAATMEHVVAPTSSSLVAPAVGIQLA
jgi:hypothetical protein